MAVYRCRTGIVVAELCHEYYLVPSVRLGEYCPCIRQINETGAYIWSELVKGTSVEIIKSNIRKRYRLNQSVDIDKQINSFLVSLSNEGFIIAE